MSEQVNQNPEPKKEGTEQLLAGKYKSQEELEKGYLELQKKLGDRPKPEPQAPEPKAPTPQENYQWKQKSAVLDAQNSILESRKQEAAKALDSGDTLIAVRSALGSSDAIAQFEADFDRGHVSAAEVQRLAALGGKPKEGTQTIPENKSGGEVTQDQKDFVMSHLKQSSGAYYNPRNPNHSEVKRQVDDIRQKLGI